MKYTDDTSAIAASCREEDLTQPDKAHTMPADQSTATSPSILRREEPIESRYGIFRSAEDAIAFAVHSSACEGLITPPEDIENLRKVARGEISGQELINHYISEALANKD